ncbi:basic proline-rich protein-like, partial [Capricornis sumatraensis]|uniref:basic proline-rich protein-like n=1 Tax=Capricornis sumatraensis TaxID=34865 RepID=UPI003604A28F
GRGRGARTRRTRPRATRRPPGSPLPTAAAAVTAAQHAARHPGPSGDGGVRGRREARLPPPRGPDRPDPKADGRPPPGVFKPPRRDALGTWRGGGGRGARRAPTGPRPDADHRPPTTASPPAAARGPRRCRPVTHGGPPPRAGRPPPGGPHRAPDSQPHPSPRNGAEPFPHRRALTRPPYGPGPAGQPRGREGAGRRPATARQAQSGGTTDDDRPRRTGPGPAAREATGQGERPRDGEAAARRAAQPARRDRRTRAARGPRAGVGERRSWPAPRATGWRGEGGARGNPPHPHRHPRRTLGPTSRDVAGRAGRGEGRTPEATPPGAAQGVSPPPPFPIPRRTGVAAEGEAREPGGAGPGRATAPRSRHARPARVNDPSAGSPTETLLRLLLPLDSQVRPSSQRSARAAGRPRRGRSEGLTKPSNR